MSTDAVVIWGELLWDRFPEGDQLGGAPANVAWHLGQAGGWARLVTRVGDDADGRRALNQLAELVDTSLVQIDPQRATGEVTVRIEAGEPRYTLHAGRAWEHIACTPAVVEAIGEAGVFVYGTLAQRVAEGFTAWRTAISHAKALKVCDANLRPTDQPTPAIAAAIELADIIKLNDREVGQLRTLLDWGDPVAHLRATRPRIVIVTHGAAGSTIYPTEGPAIDVEGVPSAARGDNVGCGDAYLAIFLFGMTMGWDLGACGGAASRWAAAVAAVRGATPLFDDDRIAELLEAP